MEEDPPERRLRGKGKGSSFFALGEDVWKRLLEAKTSNRLNFIITYLVLLAGTGSDHRLTKWSAKACEEYVGLGKPRAKHAIEELIAAKLVERTDNSTKMAPQYRLPELPRDADPIFLPVQMITGVDRETPVLRRVRETGDALLLRMLIDLYGLIQLDPTHGIPISHLREVTSESPSARKVCETGVHAVWAFRQGGHRYVHGDWIMPHYVKAGTKELSWRPMWDRLDMLKQIGALWYEPWIFDGEELDAEPLVPVDPGVLYSHQANDDEAKLTLQAFEACRALIGEREYYLDQHGDADIWFPLTVHRRAPALRGVGRLRVEADTPGRRLSFRKRRLLVEQNLGALSELIANVTEGRFNKPMQLTSLGGG